MTVMHLEIELPRTYETDIIDITNKIEASVNKSKITEGIVNIFNAGSTGAIITLEHEPGLLKDIPEFLERIIPKSLTYLHEQTWHDNNGHSHVRASLMGPSLTVPIHKGKLIHGTWQQIAFLELDDKPRTRHLVVTIIGE
ncbi:MAG: secondary thiamine-phosphate synthase enzyme YjbQ [Candidatus Hodarchaeales archaeon]|jgi:secondary thiamine-phosphate synthase enzyme